jgi:hypothetical protein
MAKFIGTQRAYTVATRWCIEDLVAAHCVRAELPSTPDPDLDAIAFAAIAAANSRYPGDFTPESQAADPFVAALLGRMQTVPATLRHDLLASTILLLYRSHGPRGGRAHMVEVDPQSHEITASVQVVGDARPTDWLMRVRRVMVRGDIVRTSGELIRAVDPEATLPFERDADFRRVEGELLHLGLRID